jgi:hypothetical protein
MMCSSLSNSVFFVGASKIAPHSFRLLAEQGILAGEFVQSHYPFSLAGAAWTAAVKTPWQAGAPAAANPSV